MAFFGTYQRFADQDLLSIKQLLVTETYQPICNAGTLSWTAPHAHLCVWYQSMQREIDPYFSVLYNQPLYHPLIGLSGRYIKGVVSMPL